jgi:FixJ family two-component response regulator
MNCTRALIAVVDDEDFIRRALARLISCAGYDVVTFADGSQFLRSIADIHPHCLILDLHMPVMSGAEVQTRIRAAGCRFPVIVMTGQDNNQIRDRALVAGASAFLRKPIDEQVLIDAIAVALSRSQPTA